MTVQNLLHLHPLHSVAHAMERMWSNMAVRQKTKAAYNKTHRELSSMSTRELADVGIDRADIPTIAGEAASIASG